MKTGCRTAMIKYLKNGPWCQSQPHEPVCNEPLVGTVEADVAIVGAGITGLSTALELAERGVSVVVLEQKWVGYGASGTNAGHAAGSAINEQLLMVRRFVGEAAVRDYVALLKEAVAYMEDFIKRYDIDCDYRATGSMTAGTGAKHRKKVQALTAQVQALGGEVDFVDEDEMRERGVPEAFKCAMWGKGGTYHPFKYVSGIRKLAEAKGVRLYEQTPVVGLKDGSPCELQTPSGVVRAKKVFLATNAYTAHLPFKAPAQRKVLPVYPSMVETEVLTQEQWSRIGWRGREAITTAHSMIESFHPSASGSIVLGTLSPKVGFRSSLDYEASQKVLAIQEAAFRRRFPMLGDVGIQHGWGGWVGLTTNFMPTCSQLEGSDNIYYAMAYQGHGVPKATLMGQIASDMLMGKSYSYQSMFTQRPPNWPVEPLRYCGFYLLGGVSRILDRLDDPLRE